MTHFPDNPHDGQTVVDEIGADQVRIWTYNEAKNEWTYKDYGPATQMIFTDQVLVRDNAEVPGMSLADPSELKTQKEVNYWLDEKASQGGGGGTPGKESLPWIQIDSWGMRRSPYGGSPIYECRWSCNQNSIHTWQYEIDVDGDGNWIDIADHPQKDDLGFSQGGEFPNQLTLGNTNQEERYPNALMRYRITAELNDVKSELSSGAIAAWEARNDVYDPPLYETGVAVDLDPYATTDYVDEEVEKCLPLAGGTLTGALSCTRPGSDAAGTYILSVKAEGLEDGKQVAFRVTADGAVKAGHDTSHPFTATAKNDVVTKGYTDDHTLQPDKPNDVTTGFRIKCDGQTFFSASGGELGLYHLKEPTDVTHAATKRYVDNAIGSGGGGGVGFTEQYNGNRFFKAGLDTTNLSEGEVMFCSNGVSTSVFTAITHVCLPEAGIDWTKFTNIGTIEVKNGGTLCGHLQVVSAMNNPGRNWKVKVKVLDIENNDLEPESGHPCYFWGMFTG